MIALFYKIRRILQWIPILWRDEDWDFDYILRILRYKLSRTRETIISNNIIAEADQVAAEIRMAEQILERLEKNDYAEDLYAAIERDFGEHDLKRLTRTGVNDENSDEYRRRIVEASNAAQKARDADLDLLFRHLRERIEFWWD